MCFLQNLDRPSKCCASFLVVRGATFFTLEGISLHAPYCCTPKNFTEIEGPWIWVGLFPIFWCMQCMHAFVTNKSKAVATSCSFGLIGTMSTIWWSNVMLCGKDRQSISFELSCDTAGELIYLWGKTLQFYTAGLANGKQIASGGPYERIPEKSIYLMNSCICTRTCVNLLR